MNELQLFGVTNEQVIFEFYHDQLYSMAIFLDPQTDEETNEMFNSVYQEIAYAYGSL